MTNHFILDFETMSTDTERGVVLDCAYLVFDWDRFTTKPYTFKELVEHASRSKFDVNDQVKNLKYVIDQDTLKFWQAQDSKVRKKILPSPEDITVESFLLDIKDRAVDIKYWWSRSNSFDPPILWRLARDLSFFDQIHSRLPHWSLRDTRTFIDAKTDFLLKSTGFCPVEDYDAWTQVFEQHNSIHDIAADVLRLQTLIRHENDLGISEIG